MSDIFFSIVTPTWNSGVHLKETVRSVLSQSETDWEWIIADDASTDGTREYIRQLSNDEHRVTIIELEKTNNPAISRNVCIEKSKGKVICFLDHDDIWDTTYLEKFKTAYLNESINCAFCGHTFYKSERDVTRAPSQVFEAGVVDSDLLIRSLIGQNRIALSAFTIDRSFIVSMGLMNGSNEVWASCDFEMYLRALMNGGKFYFINEFLTRYRVLGSSMSSSRERNLNNRKFVAGKLMENSGFYETYSREITSFQKKLNFQLSILHLLSGKKKWRSVLIKNSIGYYGLTSLHKAVMWSIVGLLPWRLSKMIVTMAQKAT